MTLQLSLVQFHTMEILYCDYTNRILFIPSAKLYIIYTKLLLVANRQNVSIADIVGYP